MWWRSAQPCEGHESLPRPGAQRAFTLIELLIVVAIIGILAAIAIPNFMNARIRAKIAKCNAEMRTWVMVYSQYRLDNGTFPPHVRDHPVWQNKFMTTPVGYITSQPLDPFQDQHFNQLNQFAHGSYHAEYFPDVDPLRVWQNRDFYRRAQKGKILDRNPDGQYFIGSVYYIWSFGPDGFIGGGRFNAPDIYDPTNGLRSNGDIVMVGD